MSDTPNEPAAETPIDATPAADPAPVATAEETPVEATSPVEVRGPTGVSRKRAKGERGNRKRVIGQVVSDKMEKTLVVAVTEHYRHPLYGKYLKRTQKFHVHDERNEAHMGDQVQIIESRPLSKTKRWRLMKVLQRAL